MATSVAFLAVAASAGAAPKRISGNLSKRGYTVIALAPNGKANAVRAGRGRFRISPPARRATLHLRAPNGKYGGPVVIAREERGRVAIVGVRAGARLGRISVRRGYAKLARRTRNRWVVASVTARARRGVPIGARRFGRVRSGRVRAPVPGDLDLDGIPDLLDIDDDGDLILDSLDRSTRVRAATHTEDEFAHELNAFSVLSATLDQTANANHPALAANIDTALASRGDLLIGLNDAPLPEDAELDCASPQERTDPALRGLRYCTRGGTGRVATYPSPPSEFPPFPGDPGGPYDSDGDGFGSVISPTGSACRPTGGCGGMALRHGADADHIGTGDLLILHASDRDPRPTTLKFVFATTPALVSFDDDGPGGEPPTPVPYPVSEPDPGIRDNGFPVTPRANGEVVLTLTFWRPQRTPIPPETAPWYDMGGVTYEAQDAEPPHGMCPQEAFSENDPNLAESTTFPGFLDKNFEDQPASPTNTFTYTLNLTKCLEPSGVRSSFDEPGEEPGFGFAGRAPNALDQTSQVVFFRRE